VDQLDKVFAHLRIESAVFSPLLLSHWRLNAQEMPPPGGLGWPQATAARSRGFIGTGEHRRDFWRLEPETYYTLAYPRWASRSHSQRRHPALSFKEKTSWMSWCPATFRSPACEWRLQAPPGGARTSSIRVDSTRRSPGLHSLPVSAKATDRVRVSRHGAAGEAHWQPSDTVTARDRESVPVAGVLRAFCQAARPPPAWRPCRALSRRSKEAAYGWETYGSIMLSTLPDI
jgi:hypothetical protein